MRLYFGAYVKSSEQLKTALNALDEVGADYDSDIDWGHPKQMICDKCGDELRNHGIIDGEWQVDDECDLLWRLK